MCFLALVYQQVKSYPVVIAANRDERVDRPSRDPHEVRRGVWAGLDMLAGGTWLGVNQHGVVAAIANQRSAEPQIADARSRGRLCLDLLDASSARQVADHLNERMSAHTYNPFNLLVADGLSGWVVSHPSAEHHPMLLEPGVHVIGNTQPGDLSDPKVSRGLAIIEPRDEVGSTLEMLAGVCRDHGTRGDGTDAICVHGDEYATVSSTLLAVHDQSLQRALYRYVPGNPCRSSYSDYATMLGE